MISLKPTGTQTLEYFTNELQQKVWRSNNGDWWMHLSSAIYSTGPIEETNALLGGEDKRQLEAAYQALKAKPDYSYREARGIIKLDENETSDSVVREAREELKAKQ